MEASEAKPEVLRHTAIKSALDYATAANGAPPQRSRDGSVVITRLEDALLWSRKDLDAKGILYATPDFG